MPTASERSQYIAALEERIQAGDARAAFERFINLRFGLEKGDRVSRAKSKEVLDLFPDDLLCAVQSALVSAEINSASGTAESEARYRLFKTALPDLRKIVNQGDRRAPVVTAQVIARLGEDIDEAEELLKNASAPSIANLQEAETGNLLIPFNDPVARHYYASFLKARRSINADKIVLKELAREYAYLMTSSAYQGVAESQFVLGNLYNPDRKESDPFLIEVRNILMAGKTREKQFALAEEFLQRAERQGSEDAVYFLAYMYESLGRNEEAGERYKVLSDAGRYQGDAGLARVSDKKGQYQEAKFLYEKAAKNGSVEGLYGLAHFYFEGREATETDSGISRDDKIAFFYTDQAIKEDNRPSAPDHFLDAEKEKITSLYKILISRSWIEDARIGLRRAHFEDSKQGAVYYFLSADEPENFSWLSKHADAAGKKISMDLALALAECYEQGKGCDVNYPKAMEMYEIAAECGSITGLQKTVQLYCEGVPGLPADPEAFLVWHDLYVGEPGRRVKGEPKLILQRGRTAADRLVKALQADREKAAAEATAAAARIVMPKDAEDEDAFIEIFVRADGSEDPQMHFALAECYALGLGTEANLEDAITHYLLAAGHGSADAMLVLGQASLNGRFSGEQNYASASAYCNMLAGKKLTAGQAERRQVLVDAIDEELRAEHTRLWGARQDGTFGPLSSGDNLRHAITVPADEEAALDLYAQWARDGRSVAAALAIVHIHEQAGREEEAREWLNYAASTLKNPDAKARLVEINRARRAAERSAAEADVTQPDASLNPPSEIQEELAPAADETFVAGSRNEPVVTDQSVVTEPEEEPAATVEENKELTLAERAELYSTGSEEQPQDLIAAWRLCRNGLNDPETPDDVWHRLEIIQKDILNPPAGEERRVWVRDESYVLCPASAEDDPDLAVVVPADDEEAMAWYAAAAEKGSLSAALVLAEQFAEGTRIDKDLTRAHRLCAYIDAKIESQEGDLPFSSQEQRLKKLKTALVKQGWVHMGGELVIRAVDSLDEDADYSNDPNLFFLSEDDEAAFRLLETYREASLDNDVEYAWRRARGLGCDRSIAESFGMLTRVMAELASSGRIRTLDANSPVSLQLQSECSRLGELMDFAEHDEEGNFKFQAQGDPDDQYEVSFRPGLTETAHSLLRYFKVDVVRAGL